MQPSSLVFVAIVALWLVALVPGWLRRRHHLAAATRPRESDAARVLEPRARRRAAAAVKVTPLVGAVTVPVDETAAGQADAACDVRTGAAAVPARPAAPVRTAPSARVAARRRAAVLALLLLATATSWLVVLAAAVGVAPGPLGGVSWAGALPVTTLLMLDLVALRAAARRRARRRRAGAAGTARAPHGRRPRPQVRQNPLRQSVTQRPDIDLDALTAPEPEEPPSEPAPWTPVPVPPPTYTLKPVVARGAPSPMDLAQRLDLAEGSSVPGGRVIFSSGPARTASPGPAAGASGPARTDGAPVPTAMPAGDAEGGATAIAATGASASAAGPVVDLTEAEKAAPEEAVLRIDLDEVLARRRAVNG